MSSDEKPLEFSTEDLIDVSIYANNIGFIVPVYMTAAAWGVAIGDRHDWASQVRGPRSLERLLLEVLISARRAALVSSDTDRAKFHLFRFIPSSETRREHPRAVRADLVALCGADRLSSPIIAIALESEMSSFSD